MAHDSISIDLRATDDGRHQIFALRGSLDIATAATVRAALVDAISTADRGVIVDLTAVDFLDSTGLSTLIGAHKRASERTDGASIRLVAQEGPILRLLRITGLLDVLAVYPTLEAAVAEDARLVGL